MELEDWFLIISLHPTSTSPSTWLPTTMVKFMHLLWMKVVINVHALKSWFIFGLSTIKITSWVDTTSSWAHLSPPPLERGIWHASYWIHLVQDHWCREKAQDDKCASWWTFLHLDNIDLQVLEVFIIVSELVMPTLIQILKKNDIVETSRVTKVDMHQ